MKNNLMTTSGVILIPRLLIGRVILFLVMGLWFFSCDRTDSDNPDFKLQRYQEIGKFETLLEDSVNLVDQVNDPMVSSLFKTKFQKDLNKAAVRIQDKFEELYDIQKKIAKKYNEKVVNIYQGAEQQFNEKVQLGLSVESTLHKSAFLSSLKFTEISLIASVLNSEGQTGTGKLRLRVPFTENILQTRKVLLIYVDALTVKLESIQPIRRFHDIMIKLLVTDTVIKESDNYIVIKLSGNLVNEPQILGWLGIGVWGKEPALLPTPQKFSTLQDVPAQLTQNTNTANTQAKENLEKNVLKQTETNKKTDNTNTVKTTKKEDWTDTDSSNDADDY